MNPIETLNGVWQVSANYQNPERPHHSCNHVRESGINFCVMQPSICSLR